MAKPVKRRRLGELFHIGRTVVIEDGEGDGVELYLRRPNPFEHEEALREGNAARARVTLRMRDPKCDEHDILEADLEAIGNVEKRRQFLVEEKRQDLYARAYGTLLDEKLWSEEKMIEEVQENLATWTARVPELTEEDEDWDDYQRALAILAEFDQALGEKVDEFSAEELIKMREDSDEDVTEACRRVLIDRAAGLHFFRDYRIACLYYGTRDPEDRSKRYFTSKLEIRELPYEIQTKLLSEYDSLDMTKDEAKNSPSAELSSPESAQQELQEIPESSGLEAVTA